MLESRGLWDFRVRGYGLVMVYSFVNRVRVGVMVLGIGEGVLWDLRVRVMVRVYSLEQGGTEIVWDFRVMVRVGVCVGF